MKVYKCNIDGVIEKLVSANNKKVAADKMNIPYKHFLKYGHETGATKDIEIALNNPGKVFKKEILKFSEWIEEKC